MSVLVLRVFTLKQSAGKNSNRQKKLNLDFVFATDGNAVFSIWLGEQLLSQIMMRIGNLVISWCVKYFSDSPYTV